MAARVSTADLTTAAREYAATELTGRAAQLVKESTDRELAAMMRPARTIPAAIRTITERVNEQVDAEERQSDAAFADLPQDPPEDEPTFEERVAAEGSYPTADPDAIVLPAGVTEDPPAGDVAPAGLAAEMDSDGVDDLLAAHPTPEAPAKPLTPREKKYALAQALVRSAADFLEGWDAAEFDGITREDAREQFASWLAYVPRKGAWDERLGTDPRPGK
jgi:hypothetical protein